jgi:nitroreductase
MPGDRFLSILDKTIPRPGSAPFDVDIIQPSTHLLLFVHRVEGLDSGLYFLFRNPADVDEIKKLSRSDFLWKAVDDTLPLYLLQPGEFQDIAIRVSCDQDIAGAGCFSLGMVARFRDTVQESPYLYRNLFWETGIIGQVLYLEAEAYGFRGTGIGCFYDDEVHRIMGWQDDAYQSLYHFTAGKPVEDPRLATHPPYAHLK